ncbi:MAG: hypothetical protein KIS92_15525 [Planctomycetota bacterium]|nr:hypothetical protein [Planctomycetota bacterium]
MLAMASPACMMIARITLALFLAGACGGPRAGEAPESALKANTWSPLPDAIELKQLNDHRAMLSQALRPKGSDWILIDKGPLYNACAQAVWAPDVKKAIMLIVNPYGNPLCNTYAYDPSSAEKVPAVQWGVASGWKRLDPAGEPFNGRLLWASLAYDSTNKEVVLFGGTSADPSGSPGTRVYSLEKNTWTRLDFSRLPLAKSHAECNDLRWAVHLLEGRMRSRLHLAETMEEAKEDLAIPTKALRARVDAFAEKLSAQDGLNAEEKEQVAWAKPELLAASKSLNLLDGKATPALIEKAADAAEHLRMARDWLAVEPPTRALASMVYEPASKKIYLFGGDHLDYLMCDTWEYDCTVRRWRQRRPKLAPEPRAGHALAYLPKSKKVALFGGFGYRSEEGYRVAPYAARPFEIWTFSPEKNEWTLVKRWPKASTDAKSSDFVPVSGRAEPLDMVVGPNDTACAAVAQKPWDPQEVFVCRVDASAVDLQGASAFGVPPGTVVRHTGKFLPSFWDESVASNSAAAETTLSSLPANKWVDIKTSKTFGVNRDWGTATYDTDRQQILWFSGGHCAYSGTDVSMYSTRANAWRISCVSDFPLGAWANTGQAGLHWSFEGRPFMHSHTYKLYAYDPILKKMLLFNRDDTFIFDPAVSEWERPLPNTPFGGGPWVPKFCTTPSGVMVWAPSKAGPNPRPGLIWKLDHAKHAWVEWKTTGGPLPATPSDDHGTLVYDSKRNQLLICTAFRDGGGELWSCNLTSGVLKKLEPENRRHGPFYPREAVYIPKGDLVLFHDAIDKAAVAYHVEKNRFVTMVIPNGFEGRNPSVGLMQDPKRGLVWAIDASWNLKVLNFDLASARFTDDEKPAK